MATGHGAAARQALADAGLLDARGVDRTRFGIYLGSGEGIQDFHNLVSLIARSYRAAEYLIDQHHLAAVNVAGGTLAWIESGRDVVVGSEPT